MIIYDLRCNKGHKFEGWFKDRLNYEEQKTGRLISCPICASAQVEMVPATLAIKGKETRPEEGHTQPKELSPMKAVQLLNEFIDKNFCDVGERFAEVALKMHMGEEEGRNIKGTVTGPEEEVLREEGVQFVKIPTVKFDS